MSAGKRRNFLHWVFFQDPAKAKRTKPPEQEWPYSVPSKDPANEWAASDIPIPLPYIGPERPFGAAPTLKKWVKLAISSDEVQEDVELTIFPIELGSVQSSIKLNDKTISPRHAVIDLHNGILTITDTHSQNGVSIGSLWLNPGVPYPVTPGKTILIGRTKLTVIDYAGATEPLDRPTPPGISLPDLGLGPSDLFADLASPKQKPESFMGFTGQESDLYINIPPSGVESFFDIPAPVIELPPEPEPEPVIVKSTLARLMDESDVILFRDVLELGPEPEPEVEPEPVLEQAKEDEETSDEPTLLDDEAALLSDEPSSEDKLPSEDKSLQIEEGKATDLELESESQELPESAESVEALEPMNPAELVESLESAEPPEPTKSQASAKPPEPIIRPLTSDDISEIELDILGDLERFGETEPPSSTPVMELSAEDFIEALIDADLSIEVEEPISKEQAQDRQPPIETIPDVPQTAEEFLESLVAKSSMPPTTEMPQEAGKICSKCNTANTPEDKFCGACGISLSTPPPTVKLFCGKCGAKNTNMTKFCGECGYKLA